MFNLLKQAVAESKFSPNTKQKIKALQEAVGVEAAARIIEAYEVSPDDYSKWLEVVVGYARDNGMNIKRKADFQDVAYAVLENDPAMLDQDMQDAVVNTIWANYKAQQQHSKVQKISRAREEEEQLMFAIKKIAGKEEEGSSRSAPEGSCGGRRAQENEESSDFAQSYRAAFQDEEYDEDDDIRWEDNYETDDDNWDEAQDDQTEIPFTDDEVEDDRIMQRGREMGHARGLEDFDPASEEGMASDEDVISRGRQQRRGRDLEDFDMPSRSKPRAFYAAEQEEQGSNKYSSPFSAGQMVVCKKDGKTYEVEIADGPGDQVGILVDGRVKMVPSKDLKAQNTSHEEEEATGKPAPGRVSFLHDVLTGENSREHLTALQKKVETEAANAWTAHHAKMPRNPHPKGSFAHKAWEKGVASAAKEVWAPKPVLDPNKMAKQKQKPVKKR